MMIFSKRIFYCLGLALLGVLTASCGGEGGPQTGGITAQVVWPGEGQSSALSPAALNVPAPGTNWVVPAGVVTITGTVTAADITTPPTTSITVNAGDSGTGSITGVPAGTNRTLTVNGLDSGGAVLYEGVTTGITVTGGQTTDAGTIPLAFVQNVMVYVLNPGNVTINVFSVDIGTGALSLVESEAIGFGTIDDFAVDPRGRYLYALEDAMRRIARYSIDGSMGALNSLGTTNLGVGSGTALAIDSTGTFLYTARGGFIDAFAIDASTGDLTVAGPAVFNPVSLTDITALVVDPGGAFLFGAGGLPTRASFHMDIGNDGTVSGGAAGPVPDPDPADIVTHPSGAFAYIASDGSAAGSVQSYGVGATGFLSSIDNDSLFESSAIAVHPSGNSLYVTYTAGNLVSTRAYSISGSGTLTTLGSDIQDTSAAPNSASITIDPSGQHVYVTDTIDDEVIILSVQSDGSLAVNTRFSLGATANPSRVVAVGLP